MSPFMILALIIVLIIAFVVVTYNKMIKMRNHADEAWSDIDVQLKRRYNLIPNLVETVKGYATHEEGVFVKVTEARNMAINAGSMKEQAQAENMLSGALKSLFAVSENYPDLKANENFMQLQNELVDTEDKIQAARRFYNSTVRDFNTKLQQFPNSMIAKMFKFEDKEFFEVEDEEQKKNVEVSFDKDKKTEAVAPVEAVTEPAAAVEAPAETPAEPAPEAPVETPAEPIVAKGEDQAKCEKCGGEMADNHTCPMPEKTEEAVQETVVEEKPAEEPSVPAEPAKCEKCGGEMTEGHTCPMPEKTEEPAPAEPAEAESEGQETPATPESAPEEKPAEEAPVAEATEAPAAMEEDKPVEATPKAPAETPAPETPADDEENKEGEAPAEGGEEKKEESTQ